VKYVATLASLALAGTLAGCGGPTAIEKAHDTCKQRTEDGLKGNLSNADDYMVLADDGKSLTVATPAPADASTTVVTLVLAGVHRRSTQGPERDGFQDDGDSCAGRAPGGDVERLRGVVVVPPGRWVQRDLRGQVSAGRQNRPTAEAVGAVGLVGSKGSGLRHADEDGRGALHRGQR
jgi:hypothetical protein